LWRTSRSCGQKRAVASNAFSFYIADTAHLAQYPDRQIGRLGVCHSLLEYSGIRIVFLRQICHLRVRWLEGFELLISSVALMMKRIYRLLAAKRPDHARSFIHQTVYEHE